MITEEAFDTLDSKEFITIKNARVNNLKNVSVAIPRNKLVVITGVSGSGKSSLAFDTLFAEGQRMYVESLNSYARQFLGRMEKPEVDYIKGISPAIAVEQKVTSKNPRSTVGTTTEIYDYLKLLFARIGKTYSPISGKEVKKDSVTDVVNYIYGKEEGTRLLVLCPLYLVEGRSLEEELSLLLQKGFSRVVVNEETVFIEELLEGGIKDKKATYYILIDRAVVKQGDESAQFRLADSIQTAFYEGQGSCMVQKPGEKLISFSDKFELDGVAFNEPTINFFSFNNPYGACRNCDGFGHVLGIDPDLVVPDKSKSIYENAIVPWRGEKMSAWVKPLIEHGIKFNFPIHRSYSELSKKEKELLWTGNEYFEGLNAFFQHIEGQVHKIQYRVMLSRYRGRTSCPECKGTRIRKEASYVTIEGTSIQDLVLLPVEKLVTFFDGLTLNEYDAKVADRIRREIKNRLSYLMDVGLGYLTMNRLTSSLSGGEFQRIKLATSLGSALVGSMYVLDEPSIGLHPKDTARLINVLKHLRDLGNTVIVVEHEEEVIKAADQVIDIGPDAGTLGGELIFQGTIDDINAGKTDSYTAKYLNEELKIDSPTKRRKWFNKIKVRGASENNLQHVDVDLPLGILTVITGVSGSGKSTLVKKIVYPALQKQFGEYGEFSGKYESISGDISQLTRIEYVDQNPIGKSSRSNPVTYIKAYDEIRKLFTNQDVSKARGYKQAVFSFNVEGGRCEACQGEGIQRIEMQFMADISLECEDCKGKKFKEEILEVRYKEKSIYDVLNMTVDDSIAFFAEQPKIQNLLLPLQRVGLGYVTLGQSSNSLSGGEAQRVKLASFLGKGAGEKEKILFIFDEPTTGLHFHDIQKLLTSINALIDKGHSVIIIEHNTEVIKSADWVIDMGPEGGERGGTVCFAGTPEDLAKEETNYTAEYIRGKL
ncbi:MAG: excinuclease ABC subunit UvrA [Cyclobacteriaceae bacterium]